MTDKPVRIGVVGVGFGATVHIPAFQSEGLDVVAIAARRRERAAEAAARFGIPHVCADYADLLALDGLDAVSIVTPPALHREMALAALAAGKHVLLEKPFALDAAEGQTITAAAEASGRTAMIAHEFRYAAARMRVKELIDEGYLGRLRFASVRLLLGMGQPGQVAPFAPDRDTAALGGGLLFALGSHYIDCLRHWFGEVTTVRGDVRTVAPERRQDGATVLADADDTFSFTLDFASGGSAEMIASRVARHGSGATIELYGTDGTLVTPQRGPNPPPHGPLLGARAGDAALAELPLPERLRPFADERDERLMPFRLLARDFVRGIAEGTSPAPNFRDGLRCQQILDAVRAASATGRRIALPTA